MRKTNPIWPGRRVNAQNEPNLGQAAGVPRRIVQNEAKLRGTGAYGQRQLPCGLWLGRGVTRAKRTQFCPGWRHMPEANAQNEPNLAGDGDEMRKTNPISATRGKMSGGDAQPSIRPGAGSTKSQRAQNKPNFGQAVGVPRRIAQNEPNLPRPGAGDGGQICKTNPISPERPGMGAGWRATMRCRSAIVRNEANSRGQFATECRPTLRWDACENVLAFGWQPPAQLVDGRLACFAWVAKGRPSWFEPSPSPSDLRLPPGAPGSSPPAARRLAQTYAGSRGENVGVSRVLELS
jgi:hypothetical protein